MRQESNIHIDLVNQILGTTKHTVETLAEILSIPKTKLANGSILTKEEEAQLMLLSKVLNK